MCMFKRAGSVSTHKSLSLWNERTGVEAWVVLYLLKDFELIIPFTLSLVSADHET